MIIKGFFGSITKFAIIVKLFLYMFITFLGLLKMSSKLETCCGFFIEYLAKNLERKILAFTQRGLTYHMLMRILFVMAKISGHFH